MVESPYTVGVELRRRGMLFDCRGYVLSPRAVVHGTLTVTELMAPGTPAFPEGIGAGVERTCDLVVEGPRPAVPFEARVEVPRRGQWLRIRVDAPETPEGRYKGNYAVLDSGPLPDG